MSACLATLAMARFAEVQDERRNTATACWYRAAPTGTARHTHAHKPFINLLPFCHF
jgi:hypothetical protein